MKIQTAISSAALILSGFCAGAIFTNGATGATTNSGGFYGCSNTKTGMMSNISTRMESCPKGSLLVSWNSAGPQGPAGPAPTGGYYLAIVDSPSNTSYPAATCSNSSMSNYFLGKLNEVSSAGELRSAGLAAWVCPF